jgi:hypothetical protein
VVVERLPHNFSVPITEPSTTTAATTLLKNSTERYQFNSIHFMSEANSKYKVYG